MQKRLEGLARNLKLFLKAALDIKQKATSLVRKEAMDELDNLMLLAFGDVLGLPVPTSYYTLELLPFLAEELESWKIRMLRRQSAVADRWGDFCC